MSAPLMIAVANQKGGFGNTVIDLDPQSNASAAFGAGEAEPTLTDVMTRDRGGRVLDDGLEQILTPGGGGWAQLRVAPATLDLAHVSTTPTWSSALPPSQAARRSRRTAPDPADAHRLAHRRWDS